MGAGTDAAAGLPAPDGRGAAPAAAGHASQFALLRERRFAPFFLTQFLGAANDNLFKFALTVLVTYELRRPDGSGGRNTEVLTFDGDQIARIEVYFGWDL